MEQNLLLYLSAIIALGILCQWLAWLLKLPSILLFLVAGLFLGPFTGFLNPDALLGNFLAPIVSASIAIILFEGSLRLKVKDIKAKASVVINLVSIGAVITWVLTSLLVYLLLGLPLDLAFLVGAILIVSGPTVVAPLLCHTRPKKPLGPILKWESILIDPLGAIAAVLVFEAIMHQASGLSLFIPLIKIVIVGLTVGFILVKLLQFFVKRYFLPESLEVPFFLMILMVGFTFSNFLQPESGLLTATVMGILLANQNVISITHVAQFKENLAIPLLANLFIILVARLKPEFLNQYGWKELLFLLAIIFLVRPIAVFCSTIKSGLSLREKLFLSAVSPRGIIAAAVSSLFAIHLSEYGFPQADKLVSLVFLVIMGTVVINSFFLKPLANFLKVSQPDPQGVLFVGAHDWAREMARKIHEEGFEVLLVDTNWFHIKLAEQEGLPHFYASVFSDCVLEEIEFEGIGKLFALTGNDEVNSLAVVHFAEVFGYKEVYQLPPLQKNIGCLRISAPKRGRILFGEEIDYQFFEYRYRKGYVIRKIKITEKYSMEDAFACFSGDFIPLFLITEDRKKIKVYTTDYRPNPSPGDLLVALTPPK
ncbi:cation:proton antiporter [Thermodesulfatator autotrophicus]|uniref:Uncharacterized protein n=1 Tax=Thermodesulfatator autotrophicus TaxID=1795632 RepID=A0A177E8W0_9BACT|nr:sodium:proton antiporter [Thermodesulfatator autotrophicus]OAG28393.1 hypothetical protein TH606_02105 [Thermodesulfatator autotrophicus]